MLNQIRKMLGLAVGIARGIIPLQIFDYGQSPLPTHHPLTTTYYYLPLTTHYSPHPSLRARTSCCRQRECIVSLLAQPPFPTHSLTLLFVLVYCIIYLSIYLSIHLSTYLSIYLFVCLFVCLFVFHVNQHSVFRTDLNIAIPLAPSRGLVLEK